jgi:hypothetical protein
MDHVPVAVEVGVLMLVLVDMVVLVLVVMDRFRPRIRCGFRVVRVLVGKALAVAHGAHLNAGIDAPVRRLMALGANASQGFHSSETLTCLGSTGWKCTSSTPPAGSPGRREA